MRHLTCEMVSAHLLTSLAAFEFRARSLIPSLCPVQLLKDFFYAIEEAHDSNVVLAYHDVGSDGGLFTAIVEMMFAGRCGVSLLLDNFCRKDRADIISTLFTEELAASKC